MAQLWPSPPAALEEHFQVKHEQVMGRASSESPKANCAPSVSVMKGLGLTQVFQGISGCLIPGSGQGQGWDYGRCLCLWELE